MALFDQFTVNLFLFQFLPFIIIFAFLYALLRKSHVLGGNDRSAKMLNALVSLAIASIVVFVNPLGIDWAFGFANLFSGATVIAIFLAFVVIFALMFGAASGRSHNSVIVLIVALSLAFIGIAVSGIVPQLFPDFNIQFDISQYSVYIILGIFLAIIILILRMFTKPEEKKN
jgi:hypothetical protein